MKSNQADDHAERRSREYLEWLLGLTEEEIYGASCGGGNKFWSRLEAEMKDFSCDGEEGER